MTPYEEGTAGELEKFGEGRRKDKEVEEKRKRQSLA